MAVERARSQVWFQRGTGQLGTLVLSAQAMVGSGNGGGGGGPQRQGWWQSAALAGLQQLQLYPGNSSSIFSVGDAMATVTGP